MFHSVKFKHENSHINKIATVGVSTVVLKHIDFWLNEEEYKKVKKRVRKEKISEYGLAKKALLNYVNNKHETDNALLILYFFIIYSLAATTYLLLTAASSF